MNPTSIHEDVGLVPGLTQWLSIQHCHELWCGLQMRLRSRVAVAVASAGSCSSDAPLAWELPYAAGVALKLKKKKKNLTQKQILIYQEEATFLSSANYSNAFPSQPARSQEKTGYQVRRNHFYPFSPPFDETRLLSQPLT